MTEFHMFDAGCIRSYLRIVINRSVSCRGHEKRLLLGELVSGCWVIGSYCWVASYFEHRASCIWHRASSFFSPQWTRRLAQWPRSILLFVDGLASNFGLRASSIVHQASIIVLLTSSYFLLILGRTACKQAWTDSSIVWFSVWSSTSGCAGASKGLSIPVKFLIFPALAFL